MMKVREEDRPGVCLSPDTSVSLWDEIRIIYPKAEGVFP